jgi:penicillin V acylase-like amidase (Ntn superfamily)
VKNNLMHPHGFSFESASPKEDRMVQTMWAIQTVVRPHGINAVDPGYGATQWTLIRDHSNQRYLFNSPAAPSFRVLDLKKLNLDTPGPVRSMVLADRDFAFVDVSRRLAHGTAAASSSRHLLRGIKKRRQP